MAGRAYDAQRPHKFQPSFDKQRCMLCGQPQGWDMHHTLNEGFVCECGRAGTYESTNGMCRCGRNVYLRSKLMEVKVLSKEPDKVEFSQLPTWSYFLFGGEPMMLCQKVTSIGYRRVGSAPEEKCGTSGGVWKVRRVELVKVEVRLI